MSNLPTNQTTASSEWTEAGEREEALRLAMRIRSFEREAQLLNVWLRGGLQDVAQRLEEHGNG